MAAVCPMCHAPAGDKECEECGYEFGQSLETLRGMLRTQLLNYLVMFWVMVFAIVGLLVSLVWLVQAGSFVLIPTGFILFLGWQAVRAARKISLTRKSLSLVAKREAALPAATVISD